MFEKENVIYIKNGKLDSFKSFLLLKKVLGSRAKNYCGLDINQQEKCLKDILKIIERLNVNFISIDNKGKSIAMTYGDILLFLDNYLEKINHKRLSNPINKSVDNGSDAPPVQPEKWTSHRIIFDCEGILFEDHIPNQIILAIIDHHHHHHHHESYLISADEDVKLSKIVDNIYNESIEINAHFYKLTESNKDLKCLNENEAKTLLKEVLLSLGFSTTRNAKEGVAKERNNSHDDIEDKRIVFRRGAGKEVKLISGLRDL